VGNWKTTTAGIFAAVSILLAQATTVLDDDPGTNPAWSEIASAFGLLGIGLFARDSSTKDKTPAKPSVL
jgi:hypothetical protein